MLKSPLVTDTPHPTPDAIARRRLTTSGILLPALERRIDELGRKSYSRHGVETVCFDLRIRRDHDVTGALSNEAPEVQDAVDRFIVGHYRKGMPRDGGTLRAIILGTLPKPVYVRTKEHSTRSQPRKDVFFPPMVAGIIEERWRAQGFCSISGYVLSVMRYDLLLGGTHVYFQDDKSTPEMLAALDRETVAEYHAKANRPPTKIKLDYLLEEAAGKELTYDERAGLLRAVGRKIRALAIEHYL
jgi:hypothetical protein